MPYLPAHGADSNDFNFELKNGLEIIFLIKRCPLKDCCPLICSALWLGELRMLQSLKGAPCSALFSSYTGSVNALSRADSKLLFCIDFLHMEVSP